MPPRPNNLFWLLIYSLRTIKSRQTVCYLEYSPLMLGWMSTSEMNPACGSVPARGFRCALDHKHLIPELLLSCLWLAPAGRYKPPDAGSGNAACHPRSHRCSRVLRSRRPASSFSSTTHRSHHISEPKPHPVKWGEHTHISLGWGEDPGSWYTKFRGPSQLPMMDNSLSFILD